MKQHFPPEEYRGWFFEYDEEFKAMLNEFRERLGYPVSFSPAPGALGRFAGSSTSRHNVERYGKVHAGDIMPSKYEPYRWIRIAKEIGFTGIGYYPDWSPKPGLHLDTRRTRYSRVSTWGAVRDCKHCKQRYTSLNTALKKGARFV